MKNIRLLVKQAKMFLKIAESTLPEPIIMNMLFTDKFEHEYELLYALVLTSDDEDDLIDISDMVEQVNEYLVSWEHILEQTTIEDLQDLEGEQ